MVTVRPPIVWTLVVVSNLSAVSTTLNRGIKGTEKLKGPFKQNCTYLEHDVQPLHTSITIDVYHRKIFI